MKKYFLNSFLFLLTTNLFAQTYDVCIIGGGASGVTAGIQAARMGAKTIIVEESAWLGGMLTSAGGVRKGSPQRYGRSKAAPGVTRRRLRRFADGPALGSFEK